MTVYRHGLSVGIERVNNELLMRFQAVGKLTHDDYEVISPMISSALEGIKEPHVKAFVDASELEGWELRAAWDDFKIGFKHGKAFEKIAVLCKPGQYDWSVKVDNWFTSAEIERFESEVDAYVWLNS